VTVAARCRVIGVGNALAPEDALGSRVCRRLEARALPPGVEVVDGGLAGIDLLRWVERTERVIFVDAVAGFGAAGDVVMLDQRAIERLPAPPRWGHDGGLAYLLRLIPALYPPAERPELAVVGAEGEASEETVDAVAELCLRLAGGAGPRASTEQGAASGERAR